MPDELIKNIISKDQELWYKINVLWQNDLFDIIAPLLRNPNTWIPLYVFLAIYIPYKFGKKGILWCLGFLVTFALSDYISASILKPLVRRIRPCNDIILQKKIHLLVQCGSGFSFPSSHATNHFALAFFMIFTLRSKYKWIAIPMLIWAITISYSQIYVGVHYPLDVLCGGLLGAIIGYFSGSFFSKRIGLNGK